MFWDHSIPSEAWRDMTPKERRKRRVQVRAYFLWENGMPGTDWDHFEIAKFEDQFNDEFYQMECRRFADHTSPEERLRLLVAEPLVGILRMNPKDITNDTLLPPNPTLLKYLMSRVNCGSFHSFNEKSFLTSLTVGQLVEKLLSENNRKQETRSLRDQIYQVLAEFSGRSPRDINDEMPLMELGVIDGFTTLSLAIRLIAKTKAAATQFSRDDTVGRLISLTEEADTQSRRIRQLP